MVHSKAANGSTIGLGITEAFAHSGANVVLNGFAGGLQIAKTRSELAHGSKAKVVYAPADMGKPRAITRMVRQTVDRFGSVDIVVSNASIQQCRVDRGVLGGEVGRQRSAEEPAQQALRRGAGLAALAVFLCTDNGASVTGVALPMDGGWTAPE